VIPEENTYRVACLKSIAGKHKSPAKAYVFDVIAIGAFSESMDLGQPQRFSEKFPAALSINPATPNSPTAERAKGKPQSQPRTHNDIPPSEEKAGFSSSFSASPPPVKKQATMQCYRTHGSSSGWYLKETLSLTLYF